jgi:hypothetical protein
MLGALLGCHVYRRRQLVASAIVGAVFTRIWLSPGPTSRRAKRCPDSLCICRVSLIYFSFLQDISDDAFMQRHSRLEFMEHNHRLTVASKKKKKEEEGEQHPESPIKVSLLSCSFNSGTRCSSPSASESGTPRSTRRTSSSAR